MSQDEEQINLGAAGQEAAGQEPVQEAPAVIDLEGAGQEAAAVTLEPPGPAVEEEDADPLHIGNLLMIVSEKLGIITGRVHSEVSHLFV
jgi:hypothetical protein